MHMRCYRTLERYSISVSYRLVKFILISLENICRMEMFRTTAILHNGISRAAIRKQS